MLKLAGLILAAAVVGQNSEDAPPQPPVYKHLQELHCFVGEWEGKATLPAGSANSEKLGPLAGKKVIIRSSINWTPGQCALIENSTYNIQGVVEIKATSIRAWDQPAGHICSHAFTSHNGTWAGVWSKTGEQWTHTFTGTNLDGEKVTGVWKISFQDSDHYALTETTSADGVPRPEVVWQFTRIK